MNGSSLCEIIGSRESSSGSEGHVQNNKIPTGLEAITLHVPIFGSQFKYS